MCKTYVQAIKRLHHTYQYCIYIAQPFFLRQKIVCAVLASTRIYVSLFCFLTLAPILNYYNHSKKRNESAYICIIDLLLLKHVRPRDPVCRMFVL